MPEKIDYNRLYANFNAPVTLLDCGTKCAPYNGGIPVCCDTRHSVPTAYPREWSYLEGHTDLWHRWEPAAPAEYDRLAAEAGPDLILIECLGADQCQREYRSLVCRSFPFFPYLDSRNQFLGLSIYWEYEDRCWVLSNLDQVTPRYIAEFGRAYETVFSARPDEVQTFAEHSAHMRAAFQKNGRDVPLIRRDGAFFLIDPQNETLRAASPKQMGKYGPFAVADSLLFPDEM